MTLAAIVLFRLATGLGLWLVVPGVRYRRDYRVLAAKDYGSLRFAAKVKTSKFFRGVFSG